MKPLTNNDLDHIELGFTFYEKSSHKQIYQRCMVIGIYYGISQYGSVSSSGPFPPGSETINGFLSQHKQCIEYLRESDSSHYTPQSIKMYMGDFTKMLIEDMKYMARHRKFLKEWKPGLTTKTTRRKTSINTDHGYDGFDSFEEIFHGSVDGDYLGG